MDALTLLRIGKLATTGKLDMSVTTALTGCEVTAPHYITTVIGADMKSVLKDAVNNDDIHHRIISGNVLTGIPVGEEGYLRFPYNQVTVIAEGEDECQPLVPRPFLQAQILSRRKNTRRTSRYDNVGCI